MSKFRTEPPDPAPILAELKDFQRRTVDHVFARMFLDEQPTRRFLVADEVGLGKTIIARGLIAKTISHLWHEVDRIDVVYICSNAAIAEQNLRRLDLRHWVAPAIGADQDAAGFARATRITLLPQVLRDLTEHKVNFVSLTPATSFDLRSSLGLAEERALLYWLIKDAWGLGNSKAPFNVLQGNVKDSDRFRQLVWNIDPDEHIDPGLASGFAKVLSKTPELQKRFDQLCDMFPRSDSRPGSDGIVERNAVIGELRAKLAQSCLDALEPDLVLLDEFQRFKHLLDPEQPAGALAGEFFNYSDDTADARVILLSATPYKMFTTSDEEEDHYVDFLDTYRFLRDDPVETSAFADLLAEYRREILRVGAGQLERLRELRDHIEKRLRSVVCRTERLGVDGDHTGMLEESTEGGAPLRPSDLLSYAALQRVSDEINAPDPLEYWKSAPYLLNFMTDYELKKAFRAALELDEKHDAISRVLDATKGVLLPWSDVESYRHVDPGNARLRWLIDDVLRNQLWKLLWIPPSLPYYEGDEPFASAQKRGITKRLIFSAWRVVPQTIACLTSYEVERRMMRAFYPSPSSTPEARRRFRPPLRFSVTDDRLTGMSVFGLLYPSITLATEVDPLRIGRPNTDLQVVRSLAKGRCKQLLSPLMAKVPDEGGVDERWYWAAPLLLDAWSSTDAARGWFEQADLSDAWYRTGDEDPEDEDHHDAWDQHVALAAEVVRGDLSLGRPPEDLADVLAELALAGPGVCALRALSRVCGSDSLLDNDVRIAAGRVGFGLLTLFNRPESVALVRSMAADEQLPYWRQTLNYAAAGNLQAVLDEYIHILHGSTGVALKGVGDKALDLAMFVRRALDMRASNLGLEDIELDQASHHLDIHKRNLRARFAVRFADDRTESGPEVQRERQIRDSFNSPFWPFVLATTSVGQEGLDFHYYCHAVVHWNLPSNPVDLEQREGRVHRFKGHAIRKNIAARIAGDGVPKSNGDPWAALFDKASSTRSDGVDDLIPFWLYPIEDGARIERHVPALPLSRDLTRLISLRKTLAVYRMVFGQARQEDLVRFLLEHVGEEQLSGVLESLSLNLRP